MKIYLFRKVFCLCLLFSSLAAAEPFRWSAESSKNMLMVKVEIAPDAYLYAGETKISASGKNGSPLKLLKSPQVMTGKDGEKIFSPLSGVSNDWQFEGEGPFEVRAEYQGCAGTSCLLPQIFVWPGRIEAEQPETKQNFKVLSGLATVQEFTAFLNSAGTEKTAEKSALSASAAGDFAMFILILFGGLALNLTPCILPMIPVNLAILGANGEGGVRTGLRRGILYGAGITIAYGTLGTAAVSAGMNFGALNSSGLFNAVIAAVFLLLALGMCGFFNFGLDRFGNSLNWRNFKGGKDLLAFCMGAVAALLAGACVAPVVISVLLFSAQRYAAGSTAALFWPFALGAGMALPWPLAGAGLAIIPRPGAFMVRIKYIFALIIALAAIYYGVAACRIWFSAYNAEEEFAKLEEAKALAEAEGKPLLIDFYASWCKNCHKMEKDVLASAEVKAGLKNVITVKFRAENLNDPAVKSLLEQYGIKGLPAFVLLPAGAENGKTGDIL